MRGVSIVINGAIATGKSTIARAVARELEREGLSAAVIDLDVVYDMLEHRTGVPKSDDASWRLARRAAAALTDTFFAARLHAVIVEGRFFTPAERAAFLEPLATPVAASFVTLRVPYQEALRRAEGDVTRTVSRDPAFLGPYYLGVERDLASVATTDLVLDTDRVSVDEAVAAITAFTRPDRVTTRRPRSRGRAR